MLHRSVCVCCQVAKFFAKYTSLVGAGPQARPTMWHVATLPQQTCIAVLHSCAVVDFLIVLHAGLHDRCIKFEMSRAIGSPK